MQTVDSLCGISRLLAAIFGKTEEEVRQKLGMPYRACLNCRKPFSSYNKRARFCNQECRHAYFRIEVICDWCGKSFRRYARQVAHELGEKGYQHIFCSRECFGHYAGVNYGFAVHPKNCSIKGCKRKWDWGKVQQLRETKSWGAVRISRALGMPVGTVGMILAKSNGE